MWYNIYGDTVNKQEIKDYANRWKEVHRIEVEEQKAASLDERWKQLNNILCLAISMGLSLTKEKKEDEDVLSRWKCLHSLQ